MQFVYLFTIKHEPYYKEIIKPTYKRVAKKKKLKKFFNFYMTLMIKQKLNVNDESNERNGLPSSRIFQVYIAPLSPSYLPKEHKNKNTQIQRYVIYFFKLSCIF